MGDENEGSIISGVIWMFVVSVLLFWLPGIGSLIAGIVGGMKAGGVVNAGSVRNSVCEPLLINCRG